MAILSLLLPILPALLLPSPIGSSAPPTGTKAAIAFVVPPASAQTPSPLGATSPEPGPAWSTVAAHLSNRMPGFDERISSAVINSDDLAAQRNVLDQADVVIALGVGAEA